MLLLPLASHFLVTCSKFCIPFSLYTHSSLCWDKSTFASRCSSWNLSLKLPSATSARYHSSPGLNEDTVATNDMLGADHSLTKLFSRDLQEIRWGLCRRGGGHIPPAYLFLFGWASQEHNVRLLCGRLLLADERDYQKCILFFNLQASWLIHSHSI